MEPAVYQLRMRTPDAELVDRVVACANQPSSGPPITITFDGDLVTFACETWRPILAARLEDAIAAEFGEQQQHFERP